ncbi:unnamed protein product [Arabidopsis thaliana]|uniref:FBD domain-containing protein n=1 Tax=Arabidopsis thaliana TaxID=3702 RepID=A0A654GBL7_ARATH|nr:unnamed protein product [Arabidopsis thaliana]
MDRISHLADEILSKILSFLGTKDVMQTMLLSKRFKSQWLLVPKLEFDDSTHLPETWGYQEPDYGNFRRFVDRSLLSREGRVLQTLFLKLGRQCSYDDIAIWVGIAVKRGLMELKLKYTDSYYPKRSSLPRSLYTCETLVVLKLKKGYLDVPDLVCLRSLKTLSLRDMNYSNASCLLRLLASCPVLEELFIQQGYYDSCALSFKIILPCLKKLSYLPKRKKKYSGIDRSEVSGGISGLVLDAPSLKYLHIVDRSGLFSVSEIININAVVKATLEVNASRSEKLLYSLVSVEHIRLCLSATEVVYPVGLGSSFHKLKRLEVCTCKSEWLDLFIHLLEDSPSLQDIKINQCHPVTNPRPQWNQPGSVPRCLSSSLETLEWVEYGGTHEEKELSTYLFKTAVCFKKASFTSKWSGGDANKKLQMLQELALSPRVSPTCELVFN